MGGVVVAVVAVVLITVISLSRNALDPTRSPQVTEDAWTAPTATPEVTATPDPGELPIIDTESDWQDEEGGQNLSGGEPDDQDFGDGDGDYDRPTPKPTPVNNYRKASPEQIEELQWRLIDLRWLDDGWPSGKYDKATESAVKDFQRHVIYTYGANLRVDGTAGGATIQWLYDKNAPIKPEITPTPAVTPTPAPEPAAESAPLEVVGGEAQAEDDWIVVNAGTRDNPRYFKLGAVSPAEGYTLEAEDISGDGNVPAFVYTPDGASAIEDVMVLAARGRAEELAGRVSASYASYLKGAVVSEVSRMVLGGRDGWTFSCDYDDADDPDAAAESDAAATPAPARPARMVLIYFDAPHGMSVLTSITAKADDAAQLPSVDEMYKALETVAQGMTIEGEAKATAAPVFSAEATAPAEATATPAPAA